MELPNEKDNNQPANKIIKFPHSERYSRPQPGNDEMFILKNDLGNPIPNFPYKIVLEDGRVYRGVTNSQGETMRVYTGDKKIKLSVYKDKGEDLL